MTTTKRIKQLETRIQTQRPCRILSREEVEAALLKITPEELQQIPDNEMHGILTGRMVKAALGEL